MDNVGTVGAGPLGPAGRLVAPADVCSGLGLAGDPQAAAAVTTTTPATRGFTRDMKELKVITRLKILHASCLV
jgi:hypothetical protein